MAEKLGKIVRIWREDGEVFAVEKVANPPIRGAGPRPYRLWHNGQPAFGGQWHYNISGARWRVDYVMGQRRSDAKRRAEDHVNKLHTENARLRLRLKQAEEALAPFAEWGGWNTEPDPDFALNGIWSGQEQKARITTWFGPTDFYKAKTVVRVIEQDREKFDGH